MLAAPGVAELFAALWSVAFAFGFTGCEYEGEVDDEALLEGCVVVVLVDCEVVVLDWALLADWPVGLVAAAD